MVRQAPAAYQGTEANAALEAGDLNPIMSILRKTARAHRMRRVAQETSLGRESLYKSLRAGASLEFATVLKVARALGIRLRVETASEPTWR